ncbi:hypothetical protein LTR37_010463 [Vermiconidia calcicola]|uniref:Uncharacterized protein n=1 Tax=Vermiconidia calcicola TaxID=1690605 RepID=A0ACC3N5I5_9PEZI|nr:hypothetical protein LTR37_010463 [Vermiconidia calcicola]
MTFRTLVYTYLLGGITFIPLVLAAILIPAWLALPRVDDETNEDLDGGTAADKKKTKANGGLLGDAKVETGSANADAAAEGTFAVLRTYDAQAAHAALAARSSSGTVASDGAGDAGGGNDSVYQSMYYSVFDRNKNAAPSKSVLANGEDGAAEAANGKAKKKMPSVNVFYIVLRHGHLMLYDSPAQLEVRHVISLAHHSVSISGSGTPDDGQHMRESDLFIKKTAIVLTPTELPNGHLQSCAAPPRPFYLFCTLCSEKEDFYHALLYTRSRPPIPDPLDPNDAIKLQSSLHSTSMTPETRALNAIVSRIFLALYHTDRIKSLVQRKIEKKISRVQKPAFIASLAVQSIDLGDAAPVLSNPRLKDLNISGDMTIGFDIRYSGGFKITVAALAKLDLGPRFKTRTVDLVLASSLQRLHGKVLVRIKPPPSNRIWFCFEASPDMDVRVEPVVSQRRISYAFILRAIEDRIRAVVAETLVKPNWDDIPFYDTSGQTVRGGIWRDEGGQAEVAESSAGDVLKEKNDKTKSMPVLPGSVEPVDSSATSSGSESPSKLATGSSTATRPTTADLKRRSVASLPARSATNLSVAESLDDRRSVTPPPRPLRSPSFASTSAPSVAVSVDELSANMDARAPAPTPQQKRWRVRPAPAAPPKKEAVEAIRQVRDRVLANREAAEAETTAADERERGDMDAAATRDDASSDTARSLGAQGDGASAQPTFWSNSSIKSAKRTDSTFSTSSGATTNSRASSQQQQRKQNILAATAAATNAARTWSWNALANARNKGSPVGQKDPPSSSAQSQQQQQPMGRGQPLPPPGVPLPGPQQRTSFLGGLGSVRRKPIPAQRPALPPRRTTEVEMNEPSKHDAVGEPGNEVAGEDERIAMSDEFGPWSYNSGVEVGGRDLDGRHQDADSAPDGASNASIPLTADTGSEMESLGLIGEQTAPAESEKKLPPPLPPRPQHQEEVLDGSSASTSDLYDTNAPDDRGNGATVLEHEVLPTADKFTRSEQGGIDQDSNDPSIIPAVQSSEHADAASVLGDSVDEGDLEHLPQRLDASTYETKKLDADDDDDDIVAIPAPIENVNTEVTRGEFAPKTAGGEGSGHDVPAAESNERVGGETPRPMAAAKAES